MAEPARRGCAGCVGVADGARTCGVRDHADLLAAELAGEGVRCSSTGSLASRAPRRRARAEFSAWTRGLRRGPRSRAPRGDPAALLGLLLLPPRRAVVRAARLRGAAAHGPPAGRAAARVRLPLELRRARAARSGPLTQRAALIEVMRASAAAIVTTDRARELAGLAALAAAAAVAVAPVFSNLPPPSPGARRDDAGAASIGLFGYAYEGAALELVLDALQLLRDGQPGLAPAAARRARPGLARRRRRGAAGAAERGLEQASRSPACCRPRSSPTRSPAARCCCSPTPPVPRSRKGTLAGVAGLGAARRCDRRAAHAGAELRARPRRACRGRRRRARSPALAASCSPTRARPTRSAPVAVRSQKARWVSRSTAEAVRACCAPRRRTGRCQASARARGSPRAASALPSGGEALLHGALPASPISRWRAVSASISPGRPRAGRVRRRHRQPADAVLQPVADAAGRARNGRPAARKALDADEPERLGPQRRHHHDRRVRELLREVPAAEPALKCTLSAMPSLAASSAHRGAVRARRRTARTHRRPRAPRGSGPRRPSGDDPAREHHAPAALVPGSRPRRHRREVRHQRARADPVNAQVTVDGGRVGDRKVSGLKGREAEARVAVLDGKRFRVARVAAPDQVRDAAGAVRAVALPAGLEVMHAGGARRVAVGAEDDRCARAQLAHQRGVIHLVQVDHLGGDPSDVADARGGRALAEQRGPLDQLTPSISSASSAFAAITETRTPRSASAPALAIACAATPPSRAQRGVMNSTELGASIWRHSSIAEPDFAGRSGSQRLGGRARDDSLRVPMAETATSTPRPSGARPQGHGRR